MIWDPRDLPYYGPWKTGGPILPIEFSRVSGNGRLTLVIDRSGPDISTRFALSPRVDISEAIEDLRKREETGKRFIGFLNVTSGDNSIQDFQHQEDVIDVIKRWCLNHRFNACIWTALPSNFMDQLDFDEFSPENAISYLERLGKTARENALMYIRNAPAEVDTPVRRQVSQRWPIN